MSTNSNAEIIYTARLHWILFFWPICFLVLVFYAINYLFLLTGTAVLLLFFAMVWLGMVWASYYFSFLEIKKHQIILRTGIFVRETVDIPLNKIESIDIRQSLLGSILQYGSLIITGTGGSQRMMNGISKPLTCRRYIEQLMHS